MINKIVSGGQTGADQGALDAAIKLGIRHGGWVPKGRKTENGILPEKYALREMPTTGYRERTEKNVIDSNGTVILSRGRLSGGSAYTREMALRHDRPWIHIDLNQSSEFNAATVLSKWVQNNRIEVLNVAGPRASNDPGIYKSTVGIIESAVFLLQIADNTSERMRLLTRETALPKTVDEAVTRLTAHLSLRDKTTIANMTRGELSTLRASLADYIHNDFGLWLGNEELMASCRFVSKNSLDNEDEVAMVIIVALWENLRKTHKLRIIR